MLHVVSSFKKGFLLIIPQIAAVVIPLADDFLLPGACAGAPGGGLEAKNHDREAVHGSAFGGATPLR
ncbi:MAG: hypothetical protein M0031_04885 [Thermaerobacter sp.]|nr:hypothetical protein [Thermaerobacter sp.]